jgi:hypothetical protein
VASEFFVLFTQAGDTAAAESVTLDMGAQGAAGSERTVQRLNRGRVILVPLLTGKHTTVLDTRRFLEVLNGGALGGEVRREIALVLVL